MAQRDPYGFGPQRHPASGKDSRPAWATEPTEENHQLQHHADYGWQAPDRVLEHLRDGDELSSRTSWVIASGQQAAVGDFAAMWRSPDSIGQLVGACARLGLPRVRLVEGPDLGRMLTVYPAQLLVLVLRQPLVLPPGCCDRDCTDPPDVLDATRSAVGS